MKKELVVVSLLAAAILVSGCTQQDPGTPEPNEQPLVGAEASAYDQIEQEMEEAIEDIDLNDLENELLL